MHIYLIYVDIAYDSADLVYTCTCKNHKQSRVIADGQCFVTFRVSALQQQILPQHGQIWMRLGAWLATTDLKLSISEEVKW